MYLRERGREKDREIERGGTERERKRVEKGERKRLRERGTDRKRKGGRYRQTDRQKENIQIENETDIQTDRQKNRESSPILVPLH